MIRAPPSSAWISIIEGTEVTLTATEMTVTQDYTFYVFDEWIVDGGSPTYYNSSVAFDVTEDVIATAHYTKVISVDKTLVDMTCDWPGDCWQLVDTVVVPSDGTTVQSVITPASGWSYFLKASGTYMFWPNQPHGPGTINALADAEYSQRPIDGNWEDLPTHILDIAVDGANIDWGTYNGEHVYYYEYTGTGTAASFSIYDNNYADNIGFLTVEIYECDPNAIPLQTVVNFDMTITVHAWDALTPGTDIYVEDGIGADLVVVGFTASSGEADDFNPGNGKGKNKMSATKIGWTIDNPTVSIDYTLDIVVQTSKNPKGKQEYTSTGEHELNSGPIVYFTYAGTLYMLQGPPVTVTVVGDED